MPTYDVPGVYIEEQTSAGVIARVGTSTAAFIGPTLEGVEGAPINQAVRISSYDEFLVHYAAPQPDGSLWAHIDPLRFYLAHAVKGFYENGGAQAYIVRVGTARATAWIINNQAGEPVFTVQAKRTGLAGNSTTVQVQAASATGAAGRAVVAGSATVTAINGLDVTVNNAAPFLVGDAVTEDETAWATVTRIQGSVLTLSSTIAALAVNDTLRIANVAPIRNKFRVADTAGLWAGSVVQIQGDDSANPGNAVVDWAVIDSVDRAGFVTLANAPARQFSFNMVAPPILVPQEFQLIVTIPGQPAAMFDNLSLRSSHPGYVFGAVVSDSVEIRPPAAPPTANTFPPQLVNAVGNVAISTNGQDDDPSALAAADYEAGLNVLRDIDDVNIVCIPDGAARADWLQIQLALINHCVLLKDRVAVLDSRPGASHTGVGSVEEQRQQVQSDRGYAALYYPWLEVAQPIHPSLPRPPTPRKMRVPPCGHMAGVYARTDEERGVHKAPANTDVRGVLGLERKLSDAQQGPLNLRGINVLRIFPGSGIVSVWGARTTVDPNITDWVYVPIRRLMCFIEESIEEGIRWAVFEPNNTILWGKLNLTISEFLTRVWRDGALFGETRERAFYVRIDEALNPPSTQALGRLYIEIGVRPSYPAEFIIVRIGLWDGGGDVSES